MSILANAGSVRASLALAAGALLGGAAVRLVIPGAWTLATFMALLACVFACILLVSLGQSSAPAWRRVLAWPLAMVGLWPVNPPASPAGIRSSVLLVALAVLLGFTLVQYGLG